MIKHLTPRSPEQIEQMQRSLFSGKTVKELSYDELLEIGTVVREEFKKRYESMKLAKKMSFHPRERVSWTTRDGSRHVGIIRRRNKERASVVEVTPAGTYSYTLSGRVRTWKIPYDMMQRV